MSWKLWCSMWMSPSGNRGDELISGLQARCSGTWKEDDRAGRWEAENEAMARNSAFNASISTLLRRVFLHFPTHSLKAWFTAAVNSESKRLRHQIYHRPMWRCGSILLLSVVSSHGLPQAKPSQVALPQFAVATQLPLPFQTPATYL